MKEIRDAVVRLAEKVSLADYLRPISLAQWPGNRGVGFFDLVQLAET